MSKATIPTSLKWLRRLRRWFAWTTLWALGVLIIILIIKPSEPFKGCVHANKNGDAYETLHERNAGTIAWFTRFYLRSRLVAVCAANFAEHNDRAIGALSAIALALFTLYLWRATHGLRRYAGIQASDMQDLLDAARDYATAAASQAESMRQLHAVSEAQERVMREQANATAKIAEASLDQLRFLIATESPVFFWDDFKLEPLSGDAASRLSHDVYYRPGAIIKNIGRSPLELRAFCIEPMRGGFRTDFGPGPKYNRIISLEFLVEAGREVPLYSDHLIHFYENEAQEFNRGDRMFYLYGFVRYYNQFTDESWEAGRIGVWRPSIGFVPIGIPGYVYHRRQTAENGNRNPML
jgi:hypothetical protein